MCSNLHTAKLSPRWSLHWAGCVCSHLHYVHKSIGPHLIIIWGWALAPFQFQCREVLMLTMTIMCISLHGKGPFMFQHDCARWACCGRAWLALPQPHRTPLGRTIREIFSQVIYSSISVQPKWSFGWMGKNFHSQIFYVKGFSEEWKVL